MLGRAAGADDPLDRGRNRDRRTVASVCGFGA